MVNYCPVIEFIYIYVCVCVCVCVYKLFKLYRRSQIWYVTSSTTVSLCSVFPSNTERRETVVDEVTYQSGE